MKTIDDIDSSFFTIINIKDITIFLFRLFLNHE